MNAVVSATGRHQWPLIVAGPVSVLTGGLTGLGFQPVGWWWATIVGFAAFTWLLRGLGARRGFAIGYLYGLGFLGVTIWWVINFGWWIPLLLVGFMALWPALAGWATGWMTTRLGGWAGAAWPLIAACSWTGTEWLAQRVPFGGFDWSRFAYTVADQPLGGLLPVIGAGGVSFVVAATGAVLAGLATSRAWRSRVGQLGLALALMIAGGALRWWPDAQPTGNVSVGMIQGNVDATANAFSMGYAGGVTAMHLGETITALATWRATGVMPQLIIWPENSADNDPTQDQTTHTMITDAANLAQLPMLVGVISLGPGDDERETSALWWLPGQGSVARVDKRNLAPFGERVPLYGILGKLVPMTQRVGRQSVPGTVPGIFREPVGDNTPLVVGNVICYELAYDQTVYDTVLGGAQLMTVQSSNVSFAGTIQPAQQFAITRIRAMELRRWVVVTTTASLSGLIDPHGKVVDVTTEGQAAFRLYDVPLGSGVTPGVRIGPWLERGVAALAGLGVLAGFGLAMRRRIRAATDKVETKNL